jgi:hypothetical protein
MNKLNATNLELSSKINEKRLDLAIEKLKKEIYFKKYSYFYMFKF